MSIQDISQKFKTSEAFLALLLILIAILSFGLGRLSVLNESKPEGGQNLKAGIILKEEEVPGAGMYVASKKGTKYHLPWCSGARTVREENKVWFESREEAELAGYTPANNCRGL